VASGKHRIERTATRTRRRRWLYVAAALALLWCAWATVAILQSARDVRRASREIETVRQRTSPGELLEGRSISTLRSARSKFSRAHDRLDSWTLLPVRAVPVVGRQVRSASTLSAAAATMLDVGTGAVDEARGILDREAGSVRNRPVMLRRLAELADRTEQRLAGLRFGPRIGLVPPLARSRNDFTDAWTDVRRGLSRAAVGGRAAADLLAGPRRYLLFAANNAEMRAGSGMFLSAGELITGPEGVRLENMRSVTTIEVPPERVPLSGDLEARWGWLSPNREWRNLMLSPRFEANASLAAQMWVAVGNQAVDGVMAVDPVALEALLGVTGDVDVEGRRITRETVVRELLHDQYLRFPAHEEKPERREELGQIARGIFDALDQRAVSAPKLIDALARTARGRHLLLWSMRPEEQDGWKALGVDGGLQDNSVLVSVINRGGNKLDQYLKASAELDVRPTPSGADVAIRVRLENVVPRGEVFYIAGPHPGSGLSEGAYLGLVTLNLPAAATDAGFEGVDALAVAGGDGNSRVIGFQLSLGRGDQRTVVARFRLPPSVDTLRIEPSARVPAMAWTSGRERWVDVAARNVVVNGAE
jgi:hypothetical protein